MPEFIVRAPGRVNLIGEHTDYNLGFSLPMAIDRAIWIALRPRRDRSVRLESKDFPEPAAFSLDEIPPVEGWANYVHGMAWALRESGLPLSGWEGILASDLPVASGLSSSAALEMAVARAFWSISRWDWDGVEMARVASRNDHEWMAIQSGMLDQIISAIGEEGKAFLVDFKDLSYNPVPLPEGLAIVVLDTRVKRGLVDSAYNARVSECRRAAQYFGVETLREVTLEEFLAHSDGMEELIRRRARHVITENARTLEAASRMSAGDAPGLGALLVASHASLRDDYDVSCDELNIMVDLSLETAGCYGARMTGAGFGGCAIALVESARAPSLTRFVASHYEIRTGIKPELYVCHAANGAEVFSVG